VAVEAFLTEMMAEAPDPDTGSAHEDFRRVIRGLTHFYTGGSGRVFAQPVGEAQTDPLVQAELRTHLAWPWRALMRTICDRGVARGELRPDLDPDAALDCNEDSIYCDACHGCDSSRRRARPGRRYGADGHPDHQHRWRVGVQSPGNAQVTALPGAAGVQAGQLQYPFFGYGIPGIAFHHRGHHR
jgi:hypothetical protein